MPIQFVTSEADFDAQLQKNRFLVANFTAAWCGPCQALKPVVDALYDEEKYSKVEIVRVDLDAQGAIAERYSITSVPTFVFFEDGAETDRVTGFLRQITASLDKLAAKANGDSRIKARGGAEPSAVAADVAQYVPKGFYVLNDVIHFGDMVTLNALPLVKGDDSEAKNVFRVSQKGDATVLTDADSQALFFVPLNNICKLYSVLVKVARPQPGENLELDADELANETQHPSVVKIWPNRPGVLSFDDANGDAPHVETIEQIGDSAWYEIKVKYVRFQNVQNLNIFIDGDDEDSHTLVEKLVLVGVSGDSKDQGLVAPPDDD